MVNVASSAATWQQLARYVCSCLVLLVVVCASVRPCERPAGAPRRSNREENRCSTKDSDSRASAVTVRLPSVHATAHTSAGVFVLVPMADDGARMDAKAAAQAVHSAACAMVTAALSAAGSDTSAQFARTWAAALRVLANVARAPDDERYRRLHVTNPLFHEVLGQVCCCGRAAVRAESPLPDAVPAARCTRIVAGSRCYAASSCRWLRSRG